MPIGSAVMVMDDVNLIFMCLVLITVVHSIVLMRICMHVIDRVWPDKGGKDQ